MAVIALGADSKRPLGLGGGGTGSCYQTLQILIDWTDVTGYQGGVSSDGVYAILDLPAASFVTRCHFAVIEAWTGSSSTMQIDESTGAGTYIASGLGTTTNLSLGSVIKGHTYVGSNISTLGNGVGDDAEYDSSARTIDFTTGTADWTAGTGLLVIEFVEYPGGV